MEWFATLRGRFGTMGDGRYLVQWKRSLTGV
jgi:hypothetical protein